MDVVRERRPAVKIHSDAIWTLFACILFQGGVAALAFLDKTTLASAGLDACIKTWTI